MYNLDDTAELYSICTSHRHTDLISVGLHGDAKGIFRSVAYSAVVKTLTCYYSIDRPNIIDLINTTTSISNVRRYVKPCDYLSL